MSSGRHQGNRKRSCGTTSLATADGQPSSSDANANPTRSKRTTSRRIIEDDITPAERAIPETPLVRGTSDVLLPTGRGQGSRSISCRNSSSSRTCERPASSSARADEEPGTSSADREHGSSDARVTEDDLTPAERNISGTQLLCKLGKHPSVNARAGQNPSTTQAAGRHQGNKKRLRGTTSLARAGGQPSSSEANANPTRSKRSTPSRAIEDDITPAERAISESPLVRGTSDVRLPPTGRGQGRRSISRRNTSSYRTSERPGSSTSNVPLLPTRRGQGSRSISRRNTNSSRTYEGPGSSSARAAEEPGISSETADREDTGDAEGDLTHIERAISGTQLLRGLGNHPSVYARTGRNPSTKGLSFRGAWNSAIKLYRAANDQYKQLFVAAGFGDFLNIEPVDLPQGYLIALTERWFAETNTLHLPCCELGPTPVDWTMITGVRFGGRPIELDREYNKEKVQELLGVRGPKVFSGNRLRLSKIKPDESLVAAVPPTREARERIFRRLFLYVIGSCFFGNNQSVINYELVEYLEDIDAVRAYNWGAITYAAFLAGLRRKVTGKIGSFTAFWQFLPLWAFEYLNIYRPEVADENAFPRAMRWKFPRNLGTLDNSELTASRCQLDYVDDESQVTWEPYLQRLGGIPDSVVLAERRVRFMGLDGWEYYLGERCRRQLGLPYLVPSDPPENMSTPKKKKGDSKGEPEDHINIGSSAENFVRNDIVDHASWFANNSIGKIVDVTRLIGGPDIGRKLIGDWMAKHRPDMILVPESELKETKEALDTAKAEREKLLVEFLELEEV